MESPQIVEPPEIDLDECTALYCKRCFPGRNPFSVDRHYGLAAVLLGHQCLLVGGYKRKRMPAKYVYVYNTRKNSWAKVHVRNYDLVFGRVRMAFVCGDKLIAYVWLVEHKRYSLVILDLILFGEWRSWETAEHPQIGMGAAGCYVEERNEAIVLGGKPAKQERTFAIHVFSVARAVWYHPYAQGKPPPIRRNHAVCTTGSKIFVVGGVVVGHNRDTIDLHILSVKASKFLWSSPNIPGYTPPDRYSFQITCSQNRVFVYGGYKNIRAFDFYDLKKNHWRKAGGGIKSNGIAYTSEWTPGTSEHAAVQTPKAIWIFGGFQLPASTPLKITGS